MKKLWSTVLLVCLFASLMATAAFGSSHESGNYTYYNVDGGVAIENCEKDVTGKVVIPETLEVYPGYQPVVELYGFEDCTEMTEVVIPDTVKHIGSHTFSGCTNLSKIQMSKNVEYVGRGILDGTKYAQDASNWEDGVLYVDHVLLEADSSITACDVKEGTTCIAEYALSSSNLERLSLPASLKSFDPSSFYLYALKDFQVASDNPYYSAQDGVLFNKDKTELIYCMISKSGTYTVPNKVQIIDDYAFWDCSLENFQLPESVTTIGRSAFGYYLKTINIPAGVAEIGDGVFMSSHLETVTVDSGNTHFMNRNGIVMDRDQTRILAITPEATGTVTIPATVTDIENCSAVNVSEFSVASDNSTYQSIDGALYRKVYDGEPMLMLMRCPGKKTGSFTFPEGLASLGYNGGAFDDCTLLTSVTFSSDQKYNGGNYTPFIECESLKAIHVPESNTDFAEQNGVLFTKDLKTLLEVPPGLTGNYEIPSGTETIEGNSIWGMNKAFTSVTIPVSVTKISSFAFDGTGFADVYYLGTRAQWNKIDLGDNELFFSYHAKLHCTDDVEIETPTITTQPKSASVKTTAYATFTVKADGGELQYQWQYKKPDGSWTNCSSATTGYNKATLKVQGVTDSTNRNGYQYRCVVKNSAGSVTSKAVTLNVLAITTQPKAASVSGGNYASFKVTATGAGLKYQWQYLKPNGSWTNCSSATTGYNKATLKVQGVSGSTNRNGYKYRCKVTDSAGNTITTSAVKLTVVKLAITTQPKAASVKTTAYATFTVKASGSNLKYQWQYLKPNGSWTNCSSKTTGYNKATLKVQGVTDGTNRNGYQYRCKVTDGSSTVTSNAVKLNVLAIKTQPKAASVSGGNYASFKVTATGAGLKYQWQYLKPNGSWTNCSSKTTGYNKATLKVQGVTDSTNRNGYKYRCKVTDSAGNTITTSAVKLTVVKLAITTQPKAASVKTTAYATFTVKASGSNLKYQWQYKKPDGSWTNCSSATKGYNTATLKVQGVTDSTNRNGYQYRCKVTDGSSTVTSNAVKLNVLAITTQPKAATVSKTGTATFKVAATGSGLKYQWQYLKPDGSWTNCSSATTGYNKATLKVQGVTGSTNRNGYKYRCVITDGAGNKITSSAVKLTVK